jgi:hypothetical protein
VSQLALCTSSACARSCARLSAGGRVSTLSSGGSALSVALTALSFFFVLFFVFVAYNIYIFQLHDPPLFVVDVSTQRLTLPCMKHWCVRGVCVLLLSADDDPRPRECRAAVPDCVCDVAGGVQRAPAGTGGANGEYSPFFFFLFSMIQQIHKWFSYRSVTRKKYAENAKNHKKKKKKKKNVLKSQPEPSLRALARSLGAEWIVDELSSGRVRLDVCVNDATGASVAVVPGKPEFGELFFFYRTVCHPAVMTLHLIIPAKLLLPPHNFVFNNKKNLNAADC